MYKNTIRPQIILLISLFIVCLIGCNDPVSSDINRIPTNVSAELIGIDVDISWQPTPNGTETAYEITRSENSETFDEKLGVVDSTTTTFTDKTAKLDMEYRYKIRAIFDTETGEYSDIATVYTEVDLYTVVHFEAAIRVYNPKSGEYRSNIPIPGIDVGGIANTGKYLYTTCWEYDRIYKLDAETFERLGDYPSPGDLTIYLTYDGQNLWAIDFESSDYARIYKLDPDDLTVISSFTVPGFLEGIAYDGEHLLVVRGITNQILRVDPANGTILNEYDCNYPLTGIAYDGRNLWGVDGEIIRSVNIETGEEVYSFDTKTGNQIVVGLEFVRP